MTVIAAPSPLLALAETPPARPGGGGGDGFAPFAAMLTGAADDSGVPTPVGTTVPPGGKLLPDDPRRSAVAAPVAEAIAATEPPLPPVPVSSLSDADLRSASDAPASTGHSTRPGGTAAPAVALDAGRPLSPAGIAPTDRRPAPSATKEKDTAAPRPARFVSAAPHNADRAPDDDAETGHDAPVGDAATPAEGFAPQTSIATATPSLAVAATAVALPPQPNAPPAVAEAVAALDTPPRRPVAAVPSGSRPNASSPSPGLPEDAPARPSRAQAAAAALPSRLREDASTLPSGLREGASSLPSRLREDASSLPSRLGEGLSPATQSTAARADVTPGGEAAPASTGQEASLPSRTAEKPGIGTPSATRPTPAPAKTPSRAPTAASTPVISPDTDTTLASRLREDASSLPSRLREDASSLPSRLREGSGEGLSPTPTLTTAPQAQPPSRPTDTAGATATARATADAPAPEDRSTRATAGPAEPTARPLAAPQPDPAPAILPALRAFGAALHRAAVAERRDAAPDPAIQPIAAPAPVAAVASIADTAPLDTTDRRWPEAMVARIEQLRDLRNEGDTRIRLHPDALGQVDVTLRRDGEATHVRLHAAEPATQALLADAQPKLQQLAETRGLRLSADAGGSNPQGERRQPAPAPVRPTTNTRPPVAQSDAGTTDTRIA